MQFETIILPINKVILNRGQIEGLPTNPRKISDKQFNLLVNSIKENPEMLGLRELLVVEDPNKPEHYVVIGGNMRLKALRSLDYKEVKCKLIKEATLDQLKAYIIKDNDNFGEWDKALFNNDLWDLEKLADWGIDVPDFNNDATEQTEEQEEENDEEENDQEDLINDFYSDLLEKDLYKIGEDGYILTTSEKMKKFIEDWEKENNESSILIKIN